MFVVFPKRLQIWLLLAFLFKMSVFLPLLHKARLVQCCLSAGSLHFIQSWASWLHLWWVLFLLILWCREWWLLLRHEWWIKQCSVRCSKLENTFINLHNFTLDLSGDIILKSGGQSWCSLHNTLNAPMMSSQNNCNFIIQLLKAIDALKGISHWLGRPKRGSRPATDALHHCRS